jgi:hypothetical protein
MKEPTMSPRVLQLLDVIVKAVTSTTVKEGISRIKDGLENNNPSQPTPPPAPPKPPVPIEQQPPGPVMQPKPQEPAYPSEEQILAFDKNDPDLQNLVSRYRNTINNRHTSPLDSMFNPQGQQFLRELNGLVKTRFKV